MGRSAIVLSGLAVAVVGVQPLQAQVTMDVSKITCEQFILFQVTDPQKIAIWLSGYYHGKRGNTLLDTQGLIEWADKTKDYCRANLKMTVMQAVETLIPGGK